jgi:UDP-glucose 4-epimerase
VLSTASGDGTQCGSFPSVADGVGALVGLAGAPRAVGEVFNVGNGEEIAIGDLAERVKAITGSRSEIVHIPYDQAYEAGFEDMPRRVPALGKIEALIGYRPKVQLDEILGRVVDYFQKR